MIKNIAYNFSYLFAPPWDTGVSPPELLSFIKCNPPGCALDLGCGTGTNLVTLAKAGWNVVGVDIALLALLKARKKLAALDVNPKRLHFGVVTKNYPWTECFQLILDIGCFHYLPKTQKNKYISNINKYLSPGGKYLLFGHLDPSSDRHGITEEDVELFRNILYLEMMENSFDNHKPSGWFLFKKEEELLRTK